MADESQESGAGGEAASQPPQDIPAAPQRSSDAEAALKAAQEAILGLQGDVDSVVRDMGQQNLIADEEALADATSDEPVQKFAMPEFSGGALGAVPKGIDLLSDVDLHVKIELGRTHMLIEDVLKLGEGAVVELDKLAGDPVDVYVNDRHVARGEVLVLNDNFCVRINEILKPGQEPESRRSA